MKKPARILGAAALACLLVVTAFSNTAEAAKRKVHHRGPVVDRYASIVIDASNGQVLSERNADKPLYPASLTKMMTLYLTFEALDSGRLRKNDRLRVSRHAAMQEPSALGLEPGSTIRVEDAILGLVTKSANDAAVVLGESLGGSESGFAQRMTQKARALGMNNTRFANASGLFAPGQVSTARDMARLGQALIHHYPAYYRYFSTASFTWAGKTFDNHNHLMKTYYGMDGIKTGYVRQSGYNLVASAVRNNHRLIGVVFGGRSTATRNAQMAQLLDRGFADLAAGRGAALASIDVPKKPQFDAMGLVMNGEEYPASGAAIEEGDASDDQRPATLTRVSAVSDSRVVVLDKNLQAQLRPRPINTVPLETASIASPAGAFAVQIGAFSTHDAGVQALGQARQKLPQYMAAGKQPLVVPLMTNRGTIYRARLSGFDQSAAESACRVLRGNCLVLTAQ